MKKNIIFSVLVIVLGIFLCVIAINPGIMQENTNYGDEQTYVGDNKDNDDNGDNNNDDFTIKEKNPVAGQVIEFETKDLDGNAINSSLFQEQELTLLNLWSINCPPCVQEMPELEKIANDYKGKVRVIGIISDRDIEGVKEVIKKKNVTYTNIFTDSKLEDQILMHFDYIPVTLIVDKEGKVLEKFIPGQGDYEYFKSIITELLDK